MDSTRLISLAVLMVASVGLAVVGLGDSWPLSLVGSVLVVGSAIVFARHFWRESDRKRKQELAAYSRTLGAEVAKLNQLGDTTRRSLDEASVGLGRRIDAFSKGILEYVTQLEMDIQGLAKKVEGLERTISRSDREAARHLNKVVSQVSGVIGIYATLKPEMPYPAFGGWAVAGDCAERLVKLILSMQPKAVIEVGSGLSTVLIGQALELIGREGHVVSLEHEEKWLEETATQVAAHGVDHRVTLVHAPLVDTPIGDEILPWYDLGAADLPDLAQLIFVDGPPEATGPLARYPALPLLFDRIDDNGILLMDDASRPDELAAIERWQVEFPDLTIRFHNDSKGTVEIVKGAT